MENRTPHDVVIRPEGGGQVTYPSTGQLRLAETDRPAGMFATEWGLDVPVVKRSLGIPDFDDAPTIVSLPVLQSLAARGLYPPNLFAPDTGRSCIRDDRGQIEAVTQLIQLAPPEPCHAGAGSASLLEWLSAGVNMPRSFKAGDDRHNGYQEGVRDAYQSVLDWLSAKPAEVLADAEVLEATVRVSSDAQQGQLLYELAQMVRRLAGVVAAKY